MSGLIPGIPLGVSRRRFPGSWRRDSAGLREMVEHLSEIAPSRAHLPAEREVQAAMIDRRLRKRATARGTSAIETAGESRESGF